MYACRVIFLTLPETRISSYFRGDEHGRSSQLFCSFVRGEHGMNHETLDYIFPFFVFSYGIIMIFVLENKALDKLARERFPDRAATLRSHRSLAYASMFIGGLWSVQNLLFS